MNPLLILTLGLDLDLLERLHASIDYPVDKCLVNNGRPGCVNDFLKRHNDWKLVGPGVNLGCAGGWNMAPRIFPGEPWWIIANEDYYFLPGYLEKMVKCAQQHAATEPIIFMCNEEKPSWPCFVWTKYGIENFGTFDENFWPIYYEDCDMMTRHHLASPPVQYRAVLPPGSPQGHGKARRGSVAYSTMIEKCNVLNRDYWLAKWGNWDFFGMPAYQKPFNNPAHCIKNWTLQTEPRMLREHYWGTFADNPSLYE